MLSSPLLRATLASLLVLTSLPLAAQEWTRFRGPNGAGVSDAKTIPVEFTDKDYNWTIDLPGIGQSSPVVWKDKVFVTSADPMSGARRIHCVAAADGKIVWEKEFAASTHHIHTQNSLASSTPAVDADAVYMAWATPEEYIVLAHDHAGKELWRENLGPFDSKHGYGTSPMLVDDLVILTNDQDGPSFLVALDRKSGEERWKTPRKHQSPQSASYAVPFVKENADGTRELIVCSWMHGISSHDLATGKFNWEDVCFPNRPIGQPILAGGLIFGNSGEGSGNNTVVALKPGSGDAKPEVVYTIDKTSAPYVPSLVAYEGLLFLWGDKGFVTCADVATGKIHWRERVGGNFSASPIIVDGKLYNTSVNGEMIVIAAKPEFEILARNTLPDGTRSTPAVSDGVMYIRTFGKLISVGGK